jgi:flagellar M-ring protein FliF
MRPVTPTTETVSAELVVTPKGTLPASSADFRRPSRLLLGMLCLTLAAAAWFRPARTTLLCGNLLESDAREICDSLAVIGVDYAMGNNGSAIYVPKRQVHRARLELIKRFTPASDGWRLDLVSSPSRFGTAGRDYNAALEQELAATISRLPGVESARVLIEIPGNRGRLNGQPPFALILVYSAGEKLSDAQVENIQNLVASSTELLNHGHVAVAQSPDFKILAEFKNQTL